jgi:anti-sigma factor RsiW
VTTDDADFLACQELVELITDYLEETLPAGERRRFERHLAICPGCRNYVEQMRITIRTLGHVPPASLPAETRQRLLTTFREWKAGR